MNYIMISVKPYLLTAEATVQTAINGWDTRALIDFILKLKNQIGERYYTETLCVYECFSDVIVSGEPEAVFAVISVLCRFLSKYGDNDFKNNKNKEAL